VPSRPCARHLESFSVGLESNLLHLVGPKSEKAQVDEACERRRQRSDDTLRNARRLLRRRLRAQDHDVLRVRRTFAPDVENGARKRATLWHHRQAKLCRRGGQRSLGVGFRREGFGANLGQGHQDASNASRSARTFCPPPCTTAQPPHAPRTKRRSSPGASSRNSARLERQVRNEASFRGRRRADA